MKDETILSLSEIMFTSLSNEANGIYSNSSAIVGELIHQSCKLCTLLSREISSVTEKEVHVHIKYFQYNSSHNQKFPETYKQEYKTLAFSSNFKDERKKNIRTHTIEGNTHLQYVIQSGDIFYSNDFVKFITDFNGEHPTDKFKVSTDKYDEWYKSLMISSIRKNNDIIGFLCLDSQEINAFPVQKLDEIKDRVKFFSDFLFNYLSFIKAVLNRSIA